MKEELKDAGPCLNCGRQVVVTEEGNVFHKDSLDGVFCAVPSARTGG